MACDRIVGQCTSGAIKELVQLIQDGTIKTVADINVAGAPATRKHAMSVLVHLMKKYDNNYDQVKAYLDKLKDVLIMERPDASRYLKFKVYNW